MAKIRVLILAGGWSGEKEVSLKSGRAVAGALDRAKYEVSILDPAEDHAAGLIDRLDRIDVVFSLLHGKFGEDGCMQGFLEILGLPYVGSGVSASALSFNKRLSKECYRSAGLDVARDVVVRKGDRVDPRGVQEALGPVVVVKPVCEGSSLGVSLCKREGEIVEAVEKGFRFSDEVMVEEHVEGKEVTCCVLEDKEIQTLPLVEIVPGGAYTFFDYKAKYTSGASEEICPARLESGLAERVKEWGKTAHRALGCRVWSRTDMIVRETGVAVLETNTIPGMSENSLFPLAAGKGGMSLSALVDRMIALSL